MGMNRDNWYAFEYLIGDTHMTQAAWLNVTTSKGIGCVLFISLWSSDAI